MFFTVKPTIPYCFHARVRTYVSQLFMGPRSTVYKPPVVSPGTSTHLSFLPNKTNGRHPTNLAQGTRHASDQKGHAMSSARMGQRMERCAESGNARPGVAPAHAIGIRQLEGSLHVVLAVPHHVMLVRLHCTPRSFYHTSLHRLHTPLRFSLSAAARCLPPHRCAHSSHFFIVIWFEKLLWRN